MHYNSMQFKQLLPFIINLINDANKYEKSKKQSLHGSPGRSSQENGAQLQPPHHNPRIFDFLLRKTLPPSHQNQGFIGRNTRQQRFKLYKITPWRLL